MPSTEDRKKTAIIGVVLTSIGIVVLMYGTMNLPVIGTGNTFSGLLLIVFGILLAILSLLIFVIPTAYDYLDEAWNDRTY